MDVADAMREVVPTEIGARSKPRVRSHAVVLAAAGAALAVFGGIRRMPDGDFPAFFADLAAGRPAHLNPHRGYLLEGVFGDAVAYAFGATGATPEIEAYAWWGLGIVISAFALARLARDGSTTPAAIAAALLLTRLGDALLMWIGKTDTLLLAALILTVSRTRISLVGFAVAPFFHPMIALVSAGGVIAARYAVDRRISWGALAVAVGATGLDLAVFHALFPRLEGRVGYFTTDARLIAANALQWGVPAFLASVALPALSILAVAGAPARPDRRWLPLVAWLIGAGSVASFMVLDHTRGAGLIMFAAALCYLGGQGFGRAGPVPRCGYVAAAALLCARLAAPHYDGYGLDTFRWVPLRALAERIAVQPNP